MKSVLVLLCALWMVSPVLGKDDRFTTFDNVNTETQSYIIQSLAEAIRTCDIAVVIPRCVRIGDNVEGMNSRVCSVLDVEPVPFYRMLKGKEPVQPDQLILLYFSRWNQFSGIRSVYGDDWLSTGNKLPNVQPKYPSGKVPLYRPRFNDDDLPRLVFMERQLVYLKDSLIDYAGGATLERILEEARTMPEMDFMTKYNLYDVFSNRVYRVAESCMFHVDLPESEILKEKQESTTCTGVAVSSGRAPSNSWHAQRASHLMHLTPEEVSDIVFLAYLYSERDQGADRYKAVQARVQELLLPRSGPPFATSIGKMLNEALEHPPGKPDVKEAPETPAPKSP